MIRKLDETTKRTIRNAMVSTFQIIVLVTCIVALNYALTGAAILLSAPSDWKNLAGAAFGILSCVLIPTGTALAILVMQEYKLK